MSVYIHLLKVIYTHTNTFSADAELAWCDLDGNLARIRTELQASFCFFFLFFLVNWMDPFVRLSHPSYLCIPYRRSNSLLLWLMKWSYISHWNKIKSVSSTLKNVTASGWTRSSPFYWIQHTPLLTLWVIMSFMAECYRTGHMFRLACCWVWFGEWFRLLHDYYTLAYLRFWPEMWDVIWYWSVCSF